MSQPLRSWFYCRELAEEHKKHPRPLAQAGNSQVHLKGRTIRSHFSYQKPLIKTSQFSATSLCLKLFRDAKYHLKIYPILSSNTKPPKFTNREFQQETKPPTLTHTHCCHWVSINQSPSPFQQAGGTSCNALHPAHFPQKPAGRQGQLHYINLNEST